MKETIVFTGTARDYFRVWIVNLFLTIATLGLYSPWAKVRKKRYLYGHTWLAGSNFDYHGNPWAILRGRLIAFGAFLLYSVGGQFSPRTAAIVVLAMMPAVPWLIVRSFAFNAANSSWRNVRFGYEGRYGDALKAILPFALIPLGTLLVPLQPDHVPSPGEIGYALVPAAVFALLYPYVRTRLVRLRLDGTRFGDAAFACPVRARSFYGIYFVAAMIVFMMGLILGLMVAVSFFAVRAMNLPPEVPMFAMAAMYLATGATALAFTQAQSGNLIIGSTTLATDMRLHSSLRVLRLLRLYGVNVVAILCTLGLAIPWAVVRTLRYRASCVSVTAESLDGFAALTVERVGATGEEMGDMFALDVSL